LGLIPAANGTPNQQAKMTETILIQIQPTLFRWAIKALFGLSLHVTRSFVQSPMKFCKLN
jgi:hypothetical protein